MYLEDHEAHCNNTVSVCLNLCCTYHIAFFQFEREFLCRLSWLFTRKLLEVKYLFRFSHNLSHYFVISAQECQRVQGAVTHMEVNLAYAAILRYNEWLVRPLHIGILGWRPVLAEAESQAVDLPSALFNRIKDISQSVLSYFFLCKGR